MRSDRLNRVGVRRPVRDVEHSRRSRRRSSVRRSLALGGSTRSLTYVNSRQKREKRDVIFKFEFLFSFSVYLCYMLCPRKVRKISKNKIMIEHVFFAAKAC